MNEQQTKQTEQTEQPEEQQSVLPQGLELPSTYRLDGSPREWGDYGDDD